MTPSILYPPADHKTQWFGNPSVIMPKIEKLVIHTTETAGGWPSYQRGAITPTLTYDPWAHKWRQHLPLNGSARALLDPSGTAVRENRDGVVQVEVSCYSDPKLAQQHGHYVGDLDEQAIDDLGRLVAWLHTEWSLELAAAPHWLPYPASAGKSAVRMSSAQFDAFKGVLGHQHVSGNDHGDPGDLDIDSIMATAEDIVHPAPPVPTYSALVVNFQWPGFTSTPKSPSWATRVVLHVKAIRASGATLVLGQEIGPVEAADLAQRLGPRWHYQRNGLNAVFWRDEWVATDVATGDKSRDFNLESFGQKQRTALACRLVHGITGQYVFAASTHFASDAPDLKVSHAAAQDAQSRTLASIFTKYRQIILGADIDPELGRAGLEAGGWTFANEGSVMTAAAKERVTILATSVWPLGIASDHDGLFVLFSITDPT